MQLLSIIIMHPCCKGNLFQFGACVTVPSGTTPTRCRLHFTLHHHTQTPKNAHVGLSVTEFTVCVSASCDGQAT